MFFFSDKEKKKKKIKQVNKFCLIKKNQKNYINNNKGILCR